MHKGGGGESSGVLDGGARACTLQVGGEENVCVGGFGEKFENGQWQGTLQGGGRKGGGRGWGE